LAEELTECRFPAPRILAFKVNFLYYHTQFHTLLIRFETGNLHLKQEGSSQARYFVSRLIPAHKDPPYEQVNSTSTLFLILRPNKLLENDFVGKKALVVFS